MIRYSAKQKPENSHFSLGHPEKIHSLFFKRGFTVVELLVVIVIIGILSTITVVAFNNVQHSAKVAAIKNDLKQANTQLSLHQVEHGSFPEELSDANEGKGLTFSQEGVQLYYATHNDLTPQDYCLTAVMGEEAFKVTRYTPPTEGFCSEHLPDAPYLTATTDSVSQITITWDEVRDADSYRIEYSTSSDFEGDASSACNSPTCVKDIAGTSYSFEGLDHSTTYYFRAFASNVLGSSQASSVISQATLTQAPEGAPTINATANSTSQITVSWGAVSGATSYQLQYAIDSGFSNPTTYNGITDTSRAVTGLTAGTRYYFRAYAVNEGGNSASSNVVNTQALSVAPTITATANSTSQITITWPAVAGASSYRLERSTSSGFSNPTVTNGLTGTSRVVTGLTASTTYYFRLYSVNDGGMSAASASKNATTHTLAPASAPTISATVAATQINLSWSAITNATSYTMEYSVNSNFSGSTSITGITDTTRSITGLSQGVRYYVRGYSVGGGVTEGPGNTLNVITNINTPSAPSVSASYPGTTQAYNSGTWAKNYQGQPTSGTYYINRATLSGSSCASGTTRYFRVRQQYSSPSTWGAWTGWTTATTFASINVNSPWGVRYQAQAKCKTSVKESSVSSSSYGCYWPGKSGSAKTSCSGF